MAPAFLLLGLSHIVQPRLWAEFFVAMRQGRFAAFIIPMYTLPVALVLVVGHNQWVWDWPLFLTVAGWGMTIKCTIYLLVPGAADRMLDRRMAKSQRGFQVAGLVMAFFGGILTWQALPIYGVIPGSLSSQG
jgi:hypothetical protein